MKNEIAGYVYIMTNPSFEEYVKIGYADDVEKRLKDLNKSECIPYAFRLYATYGVHSRLDDIKIHSMLDKINPELRCIDTFNGKPRKKEFYAMKKETALEIFSTIAELSGTTEYLKVYEQSDDESKDEEEAELVRVKKKVHILPRMDWMIENGVVKIGDKISIINHPEKVAEIIDDKNVKFNGEIMSFNQFGCLVTGWKAIQFYAWAKIVGYDLTLAQMREDKINQLSTVSLDSSDEPKNL
ncbi:MAG: GIY-YIG nuclease family protein [Sphaerochaetaceae bacterium]|nr:GIY-YIG nuclease family protein [Sphaerochaetaceae bacterium]